MKQLTLNFANINSTLKHIILFVLTFLTVSIAGVAWIGIDYTDLYNIHYGFEYATLLLIFLSAHEFGHYFASKIHKVDCTLPYYIPFPPFPGVPNFGTMGAVIKTRTPIPNRKALFDIGAAGPIAGLIVSLIYLIVGFSTLPDISYLYTIHPEYQYLTELPKTGLHFGDTLLYYLFSLFIPSSGVFIPPMNEMYHYPLLNIGWFGLFVTSLNLLPIGQLDGGHIIYAMFGEKQRIIGKYFWWFILILGSGSLLSLAQELLNYESANAFIMNLQDLLLPAINNLKQVFPFYYWAWGGWLFWALITKYFIKIPHPPIYDQEPIGTSRMIIGWIVIIFMFLIFSPNGLYFIE